MLSKSEQKQLTTLMKRSIKGMVLKSDLKKWFLKIQEQNIQGFHSCDGIDLLNIANKLSIKVVETKAQYDRLKDNYTCDYSVPDLADKRVKTYEYRTLEKEVLEDMVVNKKMRQSDIAKELHTSTNTVTRYIREYEIKGRNKRIQAEVTRELLEELYTRQGLSALRIAKMIGCNKNVINNCIEKFNLRRCC